MNIFQSPWWPTDATVWCQTSFGTLQIASTKSKVLALKNRRLNARLISQAPEMWELLDEMHGRSDPQYQSRIETIQRYVLGEDQST
jgi:hypothetical protein